MEYHHTQYGYTGILTTGLLVALMWGSVQSAFEESRWIGVLIASFLVFIVALTFWFSKLKVTVAHGGVMATFGLGKPHRVIQLSDVAHVRQVRNSWVQGWGVRKITDGWMYNVWGLDAVELELDSGDVFRIGTDERDELSTAITLSLPG
ncbi:MAG: hypothetical protein M3112_00470 [Actinomycetia bacterium]|nr:hypothetical protein [Actinomycetes bacterium]